MRPTNENLENFAAPAIARWLITASQERRVVTYGEAMEKLEQEEGFNPIGRATKLGRPAGILMDRLWTFDDSAPLLNALLVLQKDRMPSYGIAAYFAKRSGDKRFREKDARKKHWKRWKSYSNKAIQEVYNYDDWEALYERSFKQKYQPDKAAEKRRAGRDGSEKDGIPRGRSGEGKNHKALRIWVTENSKIVASNLKGVRAETEVELLSGDRVDCVYYADGSTLAIEVKSSTSNRSDLQRGIYQCVKYQAVMRAMDPREGAIVEALLVTEEPLDGKLRALAKHLGVKHKFVSRDRKTIR